MTTLSGLVIDINTRKPIVGATVTSGGLTYRTDRDGKFVFHLPSAIYNVTASHPSYTQETRIVTLTVDSTITIPLIPRLGLL
jgi:hypothetical protein